MGTLLGGRTCRLSLVNSASMVGSTVRVEAYRRAENHSS